MNTQAIINSLKAVPNPSEKVLDMLDLMQYKEELDDKSLELQSQSKWIDARQKYLAKIAIHKILFTHKKLFDDVGIFNKEIPSLLDDDRKEVIQYNQDLEKLKIEYSILDKKIEAFQQKWGKSTYKASNGKLSLPGTGTIN